MRVRAAFEAAEEVRRANAAEEERRRKEEDDARRQARRPRESEETPDGRVGDPQSKDAVMHRHPDGRKSAVRVSANSGDQIMIPTVGQELAVLFYGVSKRRK